MLIPKDEHYNWNSIITENFLNKTFLNNKFLKINLTGKVCGKKLENNQVLQRTVFDSMHNAIKSRVLQLKLTNQMSTVTPTNDFFETSMQYAHRGQSLMNQWCNV